MMNARPDISLSAPDEQAIRVGNVLTNKVARASRRRGLARAGRTLIAVAALVVLGGGTALAEDVLSTDDIDINAGIGCYDQPSLDGSVTVFGFAADPVAKCANAWRKGDVSLSGPASPHLVACTGENRPVYVFPGPDSLCARLGLVPLPADYAVKGVAHAHAARDLAEIEGELPSIVKSACLSPGFAAARARVRLTTIHSGVSVSIEGDKPCVREYLPVGDHIAVVTTSRSEGAAMQRGARVDAVLERFRGSAGPIRCFTPEEFVRDVKRRFARAGVEGVAVLIYGNGRCVRLGGGYTLGPGARWVQFQTEG
jgi:hypothetical protein